VISDFLAQYLVGVFTILALVALLLIVFWIIDDRSDDADIIAARRLAERIGWTLAAEPARIVPAAPAPRHALAVGRHALTAAPGTDTQRYVEADTGALDVWAMHELMEVGRG
jgi:hypothetical protein